ncbi:MAG TPA: hypothetical protein VGD69_27495 [Herpetosiphonaceae bacterium]
MPLDLCMFTDRDPALFTAWFHPIASSSAPFTWAIASHSVIF